MPTQRSSQFRCNHLEPHSRIELVGLFDLARLTLHALHTVLVFNTTMTRRLSSTIGQLQPEPQSNSALVSAETSNPAHL